MSKNESRLETFGNTLHSSLLFPEMSMAGIMRHIYDVTDFSQFHFNKIPENIKNQFIEFKKNF